MGCVFPSGPSGRRTPLYYFEHFRKIRDKPNRMCRKASTAPDQAFIVEEALLEDLCAIAGEEAHDGGNIIMLV